MGTYHEELEIRTRGDCDIIDLTNVVETTVRKSGFKSGICTVFCPGSTGAVTTIEYEEGLLEDFPQAMERIAPKSAVYQHHLRWGDGNGHAHIRSSVIGPSLTVPFVEGRLRRGTWQQIVFIDFDNRPRTRRIDVMVVGD
ncbi:MAG: secondary thiamine-phosphate synthase enzyme YjbQ [Candidatus Thorarchaeota archaeon]